jgi:hypothetical protein
MKEANTSPPLDRHDAEAASAVPTALESSARTKLLSWSSFVFALLQSLCSAVVAISGIRVAIGLGALAAAAGIHAPARGFHADAIRIPMMTLALVGALLNLYLLWNARRLRNRPAAQWRRIPLTAKKKASERLQLSLSILTLLLLAAEWITHPMIHRVP